LRCYVARKPTSLSISSRSRIRSAVCSLGQVRPAMVNPTMRSRVARRMASAVVAEHSIPGSGAVAGTACAGAGA
jgi:hypothetical protein